MRFHEFITEEQQVTNDVDQLVADIKKGEIAPTVVQAISNYVRKKLATLQEPAPQQPQEPESQAPTVAKTQPQPATTQLPPQGTEEPEENPETPAIKEAAMQLPPGVTLKPDELRKFLLKGGFKSEEINHIVTFAYRQTIELTCQKIAQMKMYKKGAADILTNIF